MAGLAKPRPDEPPPAIDEPAVDHNGREPASEPVLSAERPTELNSATFEQLRELGLSVTQAIRVVTYRERQHGFTSLDDLDGIPGMRRSLLRKVKPNLRL